MGPKVQNLVQFAVERGLTTEYDVLSHIHAGLRSAPTTKTYKRWNEATFDRLQREAAETKAAYLAAIEAGEIVEPARPTLQDVANGHPDLESTKAAQRLLEKKAAFAAVATPTQARQGD